MEPANVLNETLEDFRRKYKGTYVLLEYNDKKNLVYYSGDNERDFVFKMLDYGDILVDQKTARENLNLFFPEQGLYNIDEQVIHFSRNPNRQWKRAITAENTYMWNIFSDINRNCYCPNLSLKTVNQMLYPVYSKLDDAIKKLEKETVLGIAINKNIAVSQPEKAGKEPYVLWWKSRAIGYVLHEVSTLNVVYEPLRQEVLDFCRKEEPTWKVL